MTTYKTSQVAAMIQVYPNTIRLYERIGFITPPKRANNGYRIFTNLHIYQLHIIKAALDVEIVYHGLRKKSIAIIKASANQSFDLAIAHTQEYQHQIQQEMHYAKEAIDIVYSILQGKLEEPTVFLKRKEVSTLLNISMDTLRNWEMNGYRIYNAEDIQRLKIIHVLRNANYSLVAILRMLHILSIQPNANIKEIIDTPQKKKA